MPVEPRWLRNAPRLVRERLSSRPLLRQVVGNIIWLVGDKIIRLGVGVWIGAWVARYLGPGQFGAMNFALALVTLLSAVATVGLPDILVRDLVHHPERRASILASAMAMRLAGGLLVMLVGAAAISYARPGDTRALLLVLMFAIGPLAQAADVVDQQYQALNYVRAIVLLRNISFAVISVARIVAILLGASVEVFAALTSIELILAGALMLRLARRQSHGFGVHDISIAECRRLFGESWPLLVRLVAIGIYMRADQVMIGHFLGDHDVGIYAAAARLSEIWYLIPVMVMTAVVPRLARSHRASASEYNEQLVLVMRLLFWMSVAVALALSLGATLIIRLLYGNAFTGAATILAVHAWAGVFVTLGVASNAWFVNEGLTRYGLYQAVAGAVVGIALNVLLIPVLGIVGAAITVVASQFVSAVLFNLLSPATRPIFQLQLKAMRWR